MKRINDGLTVGIAGFCFELCGSMPILNEFVCHSEEKSDGQILVVSEQLLNGSEKLVAKHADLNVYLKNDGSWIYASPKQESAVQVSLSADYKTISCYIAPCPDESAFYPALRVLFRTAVESMGIYNSRVSLHSACVDVGGEAVAFTGVSGMGKSTRAGAWTEAVSAELISGDRPVLHIDSNAITVHGVPWDGKEQIFRSINRPLKAIFDVRRSNSVYIRKLDAEQSCKLLMKQVFIPMWDTNAALLAIMNAKKLAQSASVYRLFCGPDENSAQKAYDILFNNPDKIMEAAKEMKIKNNFVLRKVADEYIVMPTGAGIADFDGAIALNEVSAFIFEKLQNSVSKEDLLIAVLDEYDVDRETAAKDIEALVSKFEAMGIIE